MLHDPRRAVVADLQSALHVRDRGVARLRDQRHRLIVHLVDVVSAALAVLALDADLDQIFLEARRALLAQEAGQVGDLVLGDERAVQALHLRGARRQEQHVAGAEQLVGSVLVEHGARVDLR